MSRRLRVALVCMPWYGFFQPSISLGSIKSFSEKRLEDTEIDVLNFHLRLSFHSSYMNNFYKKIRQFGYYNFTESLYSNLLYPELPLHTDFGNFKKIFKTRKMLEMFLKKLRKAQDEILESVDWSKYDIVGFTTSFIQLMSSLYAIRWIKKRYPETEIIMGGANVNRKVGKSILENFDEIDIAISGEGELNFYHLLKSRLEGNEDYKELPGIIYRENSEVIFNEGVNYLDDLDDLDFPDYSDYFIELNKIGAKNKDHIEVPLEFSRGCFHGECSFCSESAFFKGYRMKSVDRIVDEMKYFIKKYNVKRFRLTDDIIPENKLRELSKEIKKLKGVKSLFLETYGNLKPSTFKLLSEAVEDMRTQTGIESLSSSMLNKMNKKTTTLMGNIQAKKLYELYGIGSSSNYLIYHPLITDEDAEEAIRNIRLVECYSPLRVSTFSVHLFSNICRNPEKYRINIKGNSDFYKYIFPEEIREKLELQYREYEISEREEKRWEKIRKEVEDWHKRYNLLKGDYDVPILYHFQKGDRTVVVRRKIDGKERYELEGTERKVYNFCETAKSLEEIKEGLEGLSEEDIREAFEALKNKKLFFESNGKFIALPLDLDEYYENRA